VDIFPESMPGSLSELVLGWETHFQLDRFLEHHDHYRRTFRAWNLAYRGAEPRASALVGEATARTFARYFATGETFFRLREHTLYRVILRKRPRPKMWVSALWPSDLAPPAPLGRREVAPGSSAEIVHEVDPPPGASPSAVQCHYDVSNDFYALWLGPTMAYSSGLWSSDADDPSDLDAAQRRKIDFFARCVLGSTGGSSEVLDVGCGWGANLRRFVELHGTRRAVALTLSVAQREFLAARPIPGADVRLESWADHDPEGPHDAIISYGAFEHFARDGTTGVERVHAYRRFFSRCFDWLKAGGRVGLETIAHDDAPDTASPRGRGPIGDAVQDLYPESIAPHLCEIVLGFEPYFEVEVLRSDAADFARTFRLWHLALRAAETEAVALVGANTVRQFRRYLVSSEVQFRAGTLTNARIVLRRRPRWRW
jgi:cyclopropane-fatty-acyl-phospholipid synthase